MGRGGRGLLLWPAVRGGDGGVGGGSGSGGDKGSCGSSIRMMMVDAKGVSYPTHAAAGGGGLAAAPGTAAASGGSSSTAPSPPDPLGHRCRHCSYVAQNVTNLRKHTRIHTGEKPYACSWCPYRSTQSSNLKVHVKRHHPDQDRAKDGGGGGML